MKQLIAYNLTLNPTIITAFPEYYYGDDAYTGRSSAKIESDNNNLSKKRQSNIVSPKSRRRINNVTNWLVYAARKKKGLFSSRTGEYHRWKCNFITLTLRAEWLTEKMNAVDFKRELVNTWLTYAREYFNINNYIWKIERTKKGILHLHVASDTYIPWRDLRNSWNRILDRKGLLDEYKRTHGHSDANSTDVHAQKKLMRNMAAYLCKEFQKNDPDGRLIEGRLWGCSYSLSRACNQKLSLVIGDDKDRNTMSWLDRVIKNQLEIETKPDIFGKTIVLGKCYFPQPKDWLNDKLGAIRQTFLDTVQYLRGGIIQPEFEFN